MEMIDNKSYDYEFEEETKYELIAGQICGIMPYEIIGGEKIIMLPAPTARHGSFVVELILIFGTYINTKKIKARVFGDNVDVYLSKEEHFKPDVSVVCNPDIIDWNGAIHGAPDLIVEIFSDSTKKNDMGVKKDTYEKYGVKEYWLVDPINKSIIVYHLIEDKFKFIDEYKLNSIDNKNFIKVSIFEDLTVDIRDVFKWWIN